jgi:hypothetical protein
MIRPDGWELVFNRDELHTRKPAEPPRARGFAGVCALAPVDGDQGGTWIGANEHGLGLALLNLWVAPSAAPSAGFTSRGHVVRGLLDCACIDEVRARLLELDLRRHPGFRLLALAPARAPALWTWDGVRLAEEEAELPLCSSALDGGRARSERARALADLRRRQGVLDAETLLAFHRSHVPERGPWSPCMHRSDAATVSASHVRVDVRSVSFRYAPGAPCRTRFLDAVVLARAT